MLRSVIISGPPAIGKTTIAKGLGEEFGLKYLSGGDVLKEMAKEQGFETDNDDLVTHSDVERLLREIALQRPEIVPAQ